jgi:hypothetical protein
MVERKGGVSMKQASLLRKIVEITSRRAVIELNWGKVFVKQKPKRDQIELPIQNQLWSCLTM